MIYQSAQAVSVVQVAVHLEVACQSDGQRFGGDAQGIEVYMTHLGRQCRQDAVALALLTDAHVHVERAVNQCVTGHQVYHGVPVLQVGLHLDIIHVVFVVAQVRYVHVGIHPGAALHEVGALAGN